MGSPIVLLLIPTFHKLQTKVNFFLKGVWEKRRNIETSWFGFVRGPELLLRLRGVIGSGTGESLPSCRPRHLLRVLAGRAEELALINIKTSEMPSCCCAEIGLMLSPPRPGSLGTDSPLPQSLMKGTPSTLSHCLSLFSVLSLSFCFFERPR
ncbi:hypothetical protein QQF64_016043 [Cirrhinus molitorella]|uniref:Uncharacterized protein n=1 Tax=Cirrhinus molitorella TaxID=172907 RepID=A0ABR3LQ67_9TELE